VEASSQEVNTLGDGPLIINLLSGPLDATIADGSTVQKGQYVVSYRSWTDNRHFEISAPAQLRSAAEYISANIIAYQPEVSSSSASGGGSSSSK
jgi:hypothetical protein